jgi:hypothetical protein
MVRQLDVAAAYAVAITWEALKYRRKPIVVILDGEVQAAAVGQLSGAFMPS